MIIIVTMDEDEVPMLLTSYEKAPREESKMKRIILIPTT